VILSGSVLAAGPFTNGSFESASTSGVQATLAGGSTAIDGWVVTGTDVDYTSYWPAADGTQSVDLNGFGQGGVQQTFATTVNSNYVVEFWMSGNPGTHEEFPNGDASPSAKTMTVSATGASTTSYSFNTAIVGNTFSNMMWSKKSYSFKATSSSTTLSFASTTGGAFGPAIDGVTVTESAATADQCKKDGWKTMVDSLGNPFKNQGDCVSFFATGGKNLAAK